MGKNIAKNFVLTFYTTIPARIGEATNPGPPQIDQFRIGFVNPTTVLHRQSAISDLDVDILGMAETSATKPVQLQVQAQLKRYGITSHWSMPVDNHRSMINEQISLRGVAAGVAFVGRIPIRTLRDPLPTTVMQSSRVLLAYAQFGATTILTAVFYGLAAGNEQAKEETNNLLEVLIEYIIAHPGPVVLMGDFNHDPESLPALQKLQNAGYTSITKIHHHLYGVDMPKTYQEATTRDLMYFSTEIAGLITDIQVLKDTEFPGHCPVIVELSLPLGGITKQMWRVPQNFMELAPSPVLLEHEYNSLPSLILQEDAMENLQRWTHKVERAVDKAIQTQHKIDPITQPNKGLPKNYQGKFSPSALRTAAFRSFAPKARVGDFEPDVEIRSIIATQQVRQVRRLQSLRRRMTKLATYEEVWDKTWQELQQEWKAVLKAPGFGQSFVQWISQTLGWPFITMELPTKAIVEGLEEAVKAQLQHTMQEDQKRAMQTRYINHQIDHQFNYDRQAFHKIREPPHQYIQALTITFDTEAVVTQQDQKFVELRASFETCPTVGTIAKTPKGEGIVLESEVDRVLFKWKHFPEIPPFEIGQMTFTTSGMQPNDIHAALKQYWQPLWNRDTQTEAQSKESWPSVATHLQQYPIPKITENFDISSLEVWKKVIKTTNSKSVPGADGWYFEEIKSLPDRAIEELIQIFQHHSFKGFDAPYMRARIIPLPKKATVDTPDQTRPITVMPTIYRLWSAVVAHQIMSQAHHVLPEGIVGFVKGRSGLKAMHKLSWHIENTRYHNNHASGLTLDLTKAFNQFPRVPVTMILEHMGVPTKYLAEWTHSLASMEKHFDHRNWISEPLKSTTGVVEGDSLSVVGMLGIAACWWYTVSMPGIHPMAYADNLSWYADNFYQHRQVLQSTIDIFELLRIPIDWNKTWVWGTSKADYRSWSMLANEILPQGHTLQPMKSAVDLGVVMQYTASKRLLKMADRIAEALKRLHRLFHQKLAIDVTAKVIQSAIWTKAFYGQELHLLGKHHFQELRSQAAKTILHMHNPGVASLALTLVQDNLDDPEVFVILNAVRAAKAMLWTLPHTEQQTFLKVATKTTGGCAKNQGPASALKGYLLRLGVQLTPEGNLLFISGATLNLIHTPFQVIRTQIRDEWLRDLPMLTTERATLRLAPMISRRLTQQILAKFPPNQRIKLMREICHAYQTQQQKQHWTGQDTDQCPYCPAVDSKRHRATQCVALQHVYAEHEEVIHQMEEFHDIHFDLPVIFCSPYQDVFVQSNHNPAETIFVPATEAFVQQQMDEGKTPIFFSDGSCFASTIPGMGLAAWAIVVGTATTPEEINRTELMGTNPQYLSSSFLTVAVDRCHGEQSSDRSELWATLKLHEKWTRTTLVTDSEYAKSSWEAVKHLTEKELVFRANSDLLIRLRRAQNNAEHDVIKVRAHTLEEPIRHTDQSFYHTLGNMVADTAAKKANNMLSPEMVKLWNHECDEIQEQLCIRQRHYHLLLAIQPVRAKLDHNNRSTRAQQMMLPSTDNPHVSLAHLLEHWSPTPCFQFDIHWPLQTSLDSPWGEEIMAEILQWWNSMEWPLTHEGDINRSGITWTEMALDFLQDRRMAIPTRHPYHPDRSLQTDLIKLKNAGLGFFHVIKSFYYMVSWLNRRMEKRLFAGLKRGQVTSLQRQGSTNVHNGLVPRPRMVQQSIVVQTISSYRQNANVRFSGLVQWPWDDDFWRGLRIGK